MIRKKATAVFVTATLLASLTQGCATDDVGSGNENVEEGDDLLGHGELLPGPDYTVDGDPTYAYVVATEGGPQTPADWAALEQFETALDQAARETWAQLPSWVATDFPHLTEAERNGLISDFQDAIAVAQLMRDNPYSADCVEIFLEDPITQEANWYPVCDNDFGPEFENRIGRKIVGWLAARADAGRAYVGRAANYVGDVATRAAGQARVVAGHVVDKARVVAGQVVQGAKAGAAAVAMRAAQVGNWAREQARQGWALVKDKWREAFIGGVVGALVCDGWNLMKQGVVNGYRWAIGGPTETRTDTANRLLQMDGDHQQNLDVLFDR